MRFNRSAPKILDEPGPSVSLGEFLRRGRYSEPFIYRYLLPMTAAIWSVSNAQALDYPAKSLIQFWVNHHLLSLTERPVWRVVKDRSRSYVNAILAALPDVRAGFPDSFPNRTDTTRRPQRKKKV